MNDQELLRRFMAGASIHELDGLTDHAEIRLRALCVGMKCAAENLDAELVDAIADGMES